MMDVNERVDRTRWVFYSAGAMFALGFWMYIFGGTAGLPSDPTASQYDAYSLFPFLLSLLSMVALNAFLNRSSLSLDSENSMFGSGGGTVWAKIYIFTVIVVSLGSVVTAAVMSGMMYFPKSCYWMASGACFSTALITASSFTIFFGRRIEESLF